MQVTAHNEAKPDSNSMEIYIVIAIALVIVISGTYFYNTSKKAIPIVDPMPASEPVKVQQPVVLPVEDPASPPAQLTPELSPEPEVVIEPMPEPAPAIELPSLDQSDPQALHAAQQLSWLPTYATLLTGKDIIRNFVAFIDNLSRGELVANFSPLIKPADKFSVVEVDQEIYLNEDSYARYNFYVDIINSINVEFALSQYLVLKPLFDEAYLELGYTDNAFESTLYQAIETVLNAPIIREPIKLVAPSVMYKFADPELEQLPSAQKLMIRMGPDNMIKLRPKLQQIQLALEVLSNR